jgi:hypothetical protein
LFEQLAGIFTAGLVERFAGTVGVVGAGAWVAPPDGASWTPGAFELPQAATPSATATTSEIVSARSSIAAGG